MEARTFTIHNLQELDLAAEWVLKHKGEHRHLAFDGEMGAGKTTLIKAICQKLGVKSDVTSPTFALVYEYAGSDQVIYHFDFYRIDDPVEALDFGLEDYLSGDGLCLMEWPEKVNEFLPDDRMIIHIEVQSDGSRLLRLS